LQFRNTQKGLKASSSLHFEDVSMMLILKQCALASYNDRQWKNCGWICLVLQQAGKVYDTIKDLDIHSGFMVKNFYLKQHMNFQL